MKGKVALLYSCLVLLALYIIYRFDLVEPFSNPPDSTTAIVCVLHPGSGFFSQFFFLCRVYLFAKERGQPFFIEHDNWQYTYKKGWHDYFTTLNIFTGDAAYTEVKRYRGHLAEDIPEYTIQQYIDCIKEIFVLQPSLQARVEEIIEGIGDEYTSLYIRRGDKANEVALISIDDVLKQTDIQDDGRAIFMKTDDYSVVEEIKNRFPSCAVTSLTPSKKRGADNANMLQWTPEERKEDAEEFLVSAVVFTRAKTGWTYYHSNVGTFHRLSAYNTVKFYLDPKHTMEEVNAVYALDHKGSPYSLI